MHGRRIVQQWLHDLPGGIDLITPGEQLAITDERIAEQAMVGVRAILDAAMIETERHRFAGQRIARALGLHLEFDQIVEDGEQLSMFAALSSVATEQDITSVFSSAFAERWGGVSSSVNTIEIDLVPPPPLPGRGSGAGAVIDIRDRRRMTKELKERNGIRVRELVRRTGWARRA